MFIMEKHFTVFMLSIIFLATLSFFPLKNESVYMSRGDLFTCRPLITQYWIVNEASKTDVPVCSSYGVIQKNVFGSSIAIYSDEFFEVLKECHKSKKKK
jgi:hypothetical protein